MSDVGAFALARQFEIDKPTIKPHPGNPAIERVGRPYTERRPDEDFFPGQLIHCGLDSSIFHQDPRYFYKGTGSIRSRALYAIETAFLAKGDHGNWQFDYSDVLGGMASHELSTLYYPSTSRPVRKLADDVLLGFAGRAENNLLHEFVLRRFTTHVPKIAAGLVQRILPEGTPVSLISVDDWNSKTERGGPVAFMLAKDIQVDGVIVAPIGSKAWGHASFTGGDKTMQVGLDSVRLRIGDKDVPLRRTPLKDGGTALEYHRLENSGRISLVLYVAEKVSLPPAP